MAPFCALRIIKPLLNSRHLSSLLDSTPPLTSKRKIQAALSLLNSTNNQPDQILQLCRAATLNHDNVLDQHFISNAISRLTNSSSSDSLRSFLKELNTRPSMLCSFLEELKTRPDLRNELFLCHSMILYGHAGMLDHAVRTFEDMGELDIAQSTESFNALLQAGLYAKNYEEVNRIFYDFPKLYGIIPNLATYNLVVKAISESGSASYNYLILDEMERKGCKPDEATYITILAGFYKEENHEDSLEVLEMMEKSGPAAGIHTYTLWIVTLCKLKKPVEANALLERILARGMQPNSYIYQHLILGFGMEGNVEEIRRLFKDMREKGVEPDSSCYKVLISYLCQGGDFGTALQACKALCQKNGLHPSF